MRAIPRLAGLRASLRTGDSESALNDGSRRPNFLERLSWRAECAAETIFKTASDKSSCLHITLASLAGVIFTEYLPRLSPHPSCVGLLPW
ncbi:hypothetical protein BDW66DRAFT_124108 [Aspergillus desertorum]